MLSLSSVVYAEPARNLSTSVDEFCWEFFATLDRSKNILYSPYGINAALSILANGASGDTQREILQALAADNVENLNEEHKIFSETITKNYNEKNFLMESNLLLIDKKVIGRGIDKNFNRVVKDFYKSEVREADFNDDLEGEKKKIARWVSDKTKKFIPDYNSMATKETLTDILNVICFKGEWLIPFKKSNTRLQDFTNCDGSKFKVKMMSEVFDNCIAYYTDDKFKGIVLPYAENAAMYLIMPVDDDALDVSERWNNETLSYRADFIERLSRTHYFKGEVVVNLPQIDMDLENLLVENLQAMGVKKVFTDDAEIFNIVKGTSLKVSNVNHRAKIKVDEEGTEAAAVTEIIMVEATAVPNPIQPRIVYFIAERPFLFMIRDVKSNINLFTGVVNKF